MGQAETDPRRLWMGRWALASKPGPHNPVPKGTRSSVWKQNVVQDFPETETTEEGRTQPGVT